MVATTLGDAYRDKRKRARPVTARRRPILIAAGTTLAALVNTLTALFARARTAIYVWGAAGCIDAGVWSRFGMWAGLIATGISLLIIEALSGGDG